MAKEKTYTVRINHDVFNTPTKGGKRVGGFIYHRGGYHFEANTIFTVTEAELEAFKIDVPAQFKSKPKEKQFDKFLLIEEVKQISRGDKFE